MNLIHIEIIKELLPFIKEFLVLLATIDPTVLYICLIIILIFELLTAIIIVEYFVNKRRGGTSQ